MTTEPNNQIIIYEDTNGEVKLDVSLENETVWLSKVICKKCILQILTQKICEGRK